MTKFTSFLAITAMFFISSKAFAWDGKSSDISWFSNSQSEFHITTAEQLKGLSDLVLVGNTFEDKTILLDNDIDLGYSPWQPIGGNAYKIYFNGIFDGQNHKITAVHPVLDPSSFYSLQSYGLFGSTGWKSIIKNLTVTGGAEIAPNSSTNTLWAGSIVGNSGGRVENVQTDFNISASDVSYFDAQVLYVGGICGQGNTIINAKSSGKISLAIANAQWRIGNQGGIGGIVGRGGKINKVQSICDLSAWGGKSMTSVGGIVGEGWDCTIENACFYGSLSIQQDIWNNPLTFLTACSGIVGRCNNSLTVSNCISAPTSYSVKVSANYLAPIAGDSQSQNWIGSNNYYTLPPTASDNLGQVTTENKLRSGEPLEGFDSSIWEFKTNELPSIKNIGIGEVTSINNIENNDRADFIINNNKITFPHIKTKVLIEIYSLDGKKVYSNYINSKESISLRKGAYVIKIEKSKIKIAI